MFFILSLCGAGVLYFCFIHDLIPEGLTIVGCVLSFVTLWFGIGLFENNQERSFLSWLTGTVQYSGDCIGYVPDKKGTDCTLVIGKDGFLMDSKDHNVISMKEWTDIQKVAVDGHRILFDTDDGTYRFVFARPLATKAAFSVISRVAKDVTVDNRIAG